MIDYQEYYILGTDPLVYDSVTEGVSDADADCDGDGLSNIREFELGTKPFNPDTDNDGLTDGDEVNIYGTDPLKYDTDDDGISDGDEIVLGTDPLSSTTDGITDTERTFVQTIEADDEILEDVNREYNPYDLSLGITAAGNAHTSLTVQESGYSDSMFNWSILGICPELIYDNSCKVDEVVLKFKVDEEYIDNPDSEYAKENPEFAGIKRYNVFRFFEEDNILLPVKTDIDVENNTVSATVSDLGTYCLIDMECFLQDIVQDTNDSDIEIVSSGQTTEMLGASTFGVLKLTASSSSTKVKPALDYDDEFNVVFMYDTGAEGYSDFYNSVCDTTDFIFNKSVNANVYFIELEKPSCDLSYFARSESSAAGYVDKDTYDFHDSFLRDRNFTDHKGSASLKNTVVSDAFDFVVNGIRDRDGNCTEIVDTSLPTLCFSFFSDDGAVYRESTGYSLLGDLVSENVFVSLIGNYDFSTYVGGYAKDLYQQTGGKYFRMNGENISDTLIRYIYELSESEDIPDLDSKYPMILSTGLEYVELDDPITIDYINAYRDITAANHNSSRFSGYADTDDDGLYDFEEINFSSQLIKTDGGRVVLPTFGECIDYYGNRYFYVEEGLERFYNSAPNYLPSADAHRVLYNTKVLPIRSNPVDELGDSDCDGLSDFEELIETGTEPLKYNIILDNGNVDFLTDTYYFGAETYRQFYEDDDTAWLTQASVFIGNHFFGSNLEKDLYLKVITDYFKQIYDEEVALATTEESLVIINNTVDGVFNNGMNLIHASGIDKMAVQSCYKRLIGITKEMKQTRALIKQTRRISSLEYSRSALKLRESCYDELKKLSAISDNMDDLIDNSFSIASVGIVSLSSFKDNYDAYSQIIAKKDIYQDNLYILKQISENSNSCFMRMAADDISSLLDSKLAEMQARLNSFSSAGITAGTEIIKEMEKFNLVGVVSSCYDIVFNFSEQAEFSIKTYSSATLANLLSENFVCDLSNMIKCDKGFCIFDNKFIKKYKNLAYARRFAEYQYSALILSSPSWLKEWLYDYTDEDTIKIEDNDGNYHVYDKYAYNNIKYINEQILGERV